MSDSFVMSMEGHSRTAAKNLWYVQYSVSIGPNLRGSSNSAKGE